MEETAWALGFSAHEIPVLIAGKLLKPLGNPAPNTMKWFAADTVEELRHDLKWLSRATGAVMLYWRGKNARKTRAVASQRSTRRISPGPEGARSLHRNRCRRARNGNRVRPQDFGVGTDIIGIAQEEQVETCRRLGGPGAPLTVLSPRITEVTFLCLVWCLELPHGCS